MADKDNATDKPKRTGANTSPSELSKPAGTTAATPKKVPSNAATTSTSAVSGKATLKLSGDAVVAAKRKTQSAKTTKVTLRKKISAGGRTTTKTTTIKQPAALVKKPPLRLAASAIEEDKKKAKRKPPSNAPAPGKVVLRALSPEEKKARTNALARKKIDEKESAIRAVAEAAAKKEQDEEAAKQRKEEEARSLAEDLKQKRQSEQEAQNRAENETADHASKDGERKKDEPRARPQPRLGENKRRKQKLTITNFNQDEKQQSLSALRRRREKHKTKTPIEKTHITREVIIPETIAVVELASRMAVRPADVVAFLFKQDIVVKTTDALDADTAELVVSEFGHRVKRVAEADVEEAIDERPDKPEELQPRTPVVTIMGHVDHGKTSLLDALRQTAVAEKEAGGITQHIGAYQTTLKDGRKITFIDTPGHAAFTTMRARGAKTTDIVVLVIAADDSVMPQTIESINHAKAANTPLIVALNKMDLAGANENKIMQELLQYDVQCEPMGGDVQVVPLSAKTGDGLDTLSEAIALQADLMELKANPARAAQGVVLEAQLDKGAGHVATILVQRGTLKKGDVFVAGTQWGKVRRQKSFDGVDLAEAEPSCPVWVSGLNGPLSAGDSFASIESEARAREIAEYRMRQNRDRQKPGEAKTMEELMDELTAKGKPSLFYVVKTDVQGSADAIRQALESISNEDIDIKVSHAGAGEVSASDVTLAQTVGGRVLMFSVKANPEAQRNAKSAKVEMHQFDIIYALIDEVKLQAARALGPQLQETPLGSADVLELFSVGKKNTAAGCRVVQGQIKRTAHIRIRREDVIIHEGLIQSLRHFKESVAQVEVGKECGIVLDAAPKLQEGDKIECFDVKEVERKIA